MKYNSGTRLVIKCLLPFVNFVRFRTDHVMCKKTLIMQTLFVERERESLLIEAGAP